MISENNVFLKGQMKSCHEGIHPLPGTIFVNYSINSQGTEEQYLSSEIQLYKKLAHNGGLYSISIVGVKINDMGVL